MTKEQLTIKCSIRLKELTAKVSSKEVSYLDVNSDLYLYAEVIKFLTELNVPTSIPKHQYETLEQAMKRTNTPLPF